MCGLNSVACHDVVREFLLQKLASVTCLVEARIDVLKPVLTYNLMGMRFDYRLLSAVGASSGIILGWSRSEWVVSRAIARNFTLSIDFQSTNEKHFHLVALCSVWASR